MENPTHSPIPVDSNNPMPKNVLAAIGLFFVARKGYAHYRQDSALERQINRSSHSPPCADHPPG